jgi:peptidoglycan/LPS O-acetylase OafA/YrhL
MRAMTHSATVPSPPRVDTFDGLRGVAIILVGLSHGWALWPTTTVSQNSAIRPWFTSGNFAVSIFFVVSGFLMTRGLLKRQVSTGTLRPGVEFARRFLRMSAQVYLLLTIVAFMSILDPTETYPDSETRTSIVRIATYTWNWYLQGHALEARPDLGHLWYLSVDMQVFVLILLVVYMLRRRPGWLLVALGLLLAASLAWRSHAYDTEGIYQALLRTTVRMDAPLAGALAAVAVMFLSRMKPYAGWIATLSMVALLPLMYSTSTSAGFFGWPGFLVNVALALMMIACTLSPPPRAVGVPLGWAPLAFLGRHSLSLYLYHYPVFWFVARHTADWAWQGRTAVALAITAAAAYMSEALAETRMQNMLRSPTWHQLENGIPAFVGGRAKSFWARLRSTP